METESLYWTVCLFTITQSCICHQNQRVHVKRDLVSIPRKLKIMYQMLNNLRQRGRGQKHHKNDKFVIPPCCSCRQPLKNQTGSVLHRASIRCEHEIIYPVQIVTKKNDDGNSLDPKLIEDVLPSLPKSGVHLVSMETVLEELCCRIWRRKHMMESWSC